jgi:hypothetical protein
VVGTDALQCSNHFLLTVTDGWNQIVLEGVRPRARRSRISNRSLEHIFGIICVRIHNFLLCSDEVPKSRASQ